MNLPTIIETIQVAETIDNTSRIDELRRALKKLAWRKQEGDEDKAARIEAEIERLSHE